MNIETLKTWPEHIWLVSDDELGEYKECQEISWCADPALDANVKYIRADVVADKFAELACLLTDQSGPAELTKDQRWAMQQHVGAELDRRAYPGVWLNIVSDIITENKRDGYGATIYAAAPDCASIEAQAYERAAQQWELEHREWKTDAAGCAIAIRALKSTQAEHPALGNIELQDILTQAANKCELASTTGRQQHAGEAMKLIDQARAIIAEQPADARSVRLAIENIRNGYVDWQDNPNFAVLEAGILASKEAKS